MKKEPIIIIAFLVIIFLASFINWGIAIYNKIGLGGTLICLLLIFLIYYIAIKSRNRI